MVLYRTALLIGLVSTPGIMACGGRASLDDFGRGVPDHIPRIDPGGVDGGQSRDGGQGPDAASGGGPDASDEETRVGGPCESAADCGDDGALCVTRVGAGGFELTFPSGYCSIAGCSGDADCPEGSGCLSAAGMNACLALCEDENDCRADEGYTCGSFGTPNAFCLPPFGGAGPGGPDPVTPPGEGGLPDGIDLSPLCVFLCEKPLDLLLCLQRKGDPRNLPDGCTLAFGGLRRE